ncbi:MAG: LptF/LptG family permease [Candidatus Bipolaricaulota bacterium]|nr:LptF/LptG family permease [Candidatus Bipolaricaulota bacterium]MDW8110876.1 LptF/LptG family permease [Candidatus Bipolaricaulota bacterium]
MLLVDRYLLREMVFPFFLAVAGFVLFVFLNLFQQLSDFMLDRDLSFWVLVQILLYRLPELLVYGLPVGVLFAIFWALGRLSHDRELIALQAAGYSLRRLMWPVFLMGALTALIAFGVGDFVVPWANHQHFNLLRQIFLIRSAPQIREDTFFKLTESASAYVQRYDPQTQTLKTILIFDQRGEHELAELGGKFPKIIAADEGFWDGDYWRLRRGQVHKLNDDGTFAYSVTFEQLSLYAGPYLQKLFLEQRTPHEMSLSEIGEQIALLRKNGLEAQSLIVEYHTKIAVPLSAMIFALFGAPLSLIFAQGGAPRGRAAGVILSVVLVACYQGLLLWTSTLGKRDLLLPSLAPWIPNLLFGLLGALLLLVVDRWSRLDLWARWRGWLRLGVAIAAIASAETTALAVQSTNSQALLLDLRADRLTVARDWNTVIAEGRVRFAYNDGHLSAGQLQAERRCRNDEACSGPQSPALWRLVASGNVRWQSDELDLQSARMELEIEWDGQRWVPQTARLHDATLSYERGRLQAREIRAQIAEDRWRVVAQGAVRLHQEDELKVAHVGELSFDLERRRASEDAPSRWQIQRAHLREFSGETRFQSAAKREETLRFVGERAEAVFGQEGRLARLEITNGEITTCACGEPVARAAYSIRAAYLRLERDESVWATNIWLKAFGVPVFWAPVYYSSLKEESRNPLLPDFGQSPERGWYLRWRFPFVIDPQNTGALLVDYYTKLPEVGTGIEYNYRLSILGAEQRGQMTLYRLVGRGESWATDWAHQGELFLGMRLSAAIATRTGLLQQELERLFTRLSLGATWGSWRWNLHWSRDQYLQIPQDSDSEVLYRFLERTPEFSLSVVPLRLGRLPASLMLSVMWGSYREKKLDKDEIDASARWEFSVGLQSLALGSPLLTVQAGAYYRFWLYQPKEYRREAYDLTVTVLSRPWPFFSADANYTYRLVFGQSPFSFDQIHVQNHIALRATLHTFGRPHVSTGYDLSKRLFDLLRIALSERLIIGELSLTLEYDLNQHRWQRLGGQLSGAVGDHLPLQYQVSTAYLVSQRSFEDLIFKLSWREHRLSGSVDVNRLSLKRLNAETSWAWGDWEFSLKGEYDLWSRRFTALQVGVIKKFCKACWQMGLYGDGQRWWVQAQINAFPTAQVRYSPTDQRLSFGR